jgi:hypothetical protein
LQPRFHFPFSCWSIRITITSYWFDAPKSKAGNMPSPF